MCVLHNSLKKRLQIAIVEMLKFSLYFAKETVVKMQLLLAPERTGFAISRVSNSLVLHIHDRSFFFYPHTCKVVLSETSQSSAVLSRHGFDSPPLTPQKSLFHLSNRLNKPHIRRIVSLAACPVTQTTRLRPAANGGKFKTSRLSKVQRKHIISICFR